MRVRDRRAGRRRPRRRPDRAVAAVVRRGGGGRLHRAQRHDGGHRRRRRVGPTPRYVLVRGVDERGLWFFTNISSVKAMELAAHPEAALVFGWLELHRQVRVRGPVEALAPRRSTPTSSAGPARAGWRRGRRPSRRSSPTGRRCWRPWRRSRPASPARTCRRHRGSAATGWCPTRSSSGRAVPAGCTTGSASGGDGAAWAVDRLSP